VAPPEPIRRLHVIPPCRLILDLEPQNRPASSSSNAHESRDRVFRRRIAIAAFQGDGSIFVVRETMLPTLLVDVLEHVFENHVAARDHVVVPHKKL
jgi:hypothetical protein